jgi:hypothetical protein
MFISSLFLLFLSSDLIYSHTMLVYYPISAFDPIAVTEWVRRVAIEWRWLMKQSSHLVHILKEHEFQEQVLNSTEFWIVVFLDGFDCSACQTAKTNVMRLAASLKAYQDVKIGIVNCEEPGI